MSRKRLIAYAGIAILVGLALIENATNRAQLVPANVVSVASTPANEGPDHWRVTFELSSRDTYVTDPTSILPNLAQGDPICVRMHERSWADTKFTLTTETSCWDGAITPLRTPD